MLLVNLLTAIIYSVPGFNGAQQFPGTARFILILMAGPVEAMMLVSVGLLAARRQGILAVLFVLGGYSYMLMDSDYFFGYWMREWTGLTPFILSLTTLFILVAPLAFLRAKTRLGRALGLLVPVLVFHVTRLTVPLLVIQNASFELGSGDVILSVNSFLSLLMALILYESFGDLATAQFDRGMVSAAVMGEN
jgi:hypothetical protein